MNNPARCLTDKIFSMGIMFSRQTIELHAFSQDRSPNKFFMNSELFKYSTGAILMRTLYAPPTINIIIVNSGGKTTIDRMIVIC